MKKTGFWIAVLAVILACSLLPVFLLRGGGAGGTARILLNGEELRTLNDCLATVLRLTAKYAL